MVSTPPGLEGKINNYTSSETNARNKVSTPPGLEGKINKQDGMAVQYLTVSTPPGLEGKINEYVKLDYSDNKNVSTPPGLEGKINELVVSLKRDFDCLDPSRSGRKNQLPLSAARSARGLTQPFAWISQNRVSFDLKNGTSTIFQV